MVNGCAWVNAKIDVSAVSETFELGDDKEQFDIDPGLWKKRFDIDITELRSRTNFPMLRCLEK